MAFVTVPEALAVAAANQNVDVVLTP